MDILDEEAVKDFLVIYQCGEEKEELDPMNELMDVEDGRV